MRVENKIVMLEHIMLKTLIIFVASLLCETSATGITRNDMKLLKHYDIDQFKDDTQVCFFTHYQQTEAERESGIGDFMHFIQNTKFWVDKSLLAKAIMKTADPVLFINTPRKWGRSLNLDMLRLIFERNFTDPNPVTSDVHRFFIEGKVYSEGVKICYADKNPLISEETDFQKNFFQKFPVIYLNLATMERDAWRGCFKEEVSMQYRKHIYLLDKMHSIAQSGEYIAQRRARADIKEFIMCMDQKYDDDFQLSFSIANLCNMFYNYFSVECIVLIDEIDAVQNNAIFNDCDEYNEKKNGIEFMRSFMQYTFKNPREWHIKKAVLTGIVRPVTATLLGGLNNILENADVNLVKMYQYTPFYGFTHHEVKTLLCYEEQSCDEMMNTAVTWYGGYRSLSLYKGSTFNPWSIMRFAYSKIAASYWENIRSRETIAHLLQYEAFENVVYHLLYNNTEYEISTEKLHKMENLKEIHSLLTTKEDLLSYEYKRASRTIYFILDSVMSFLCHEGYLTIGRDLDENAEKFGGKLKLVIPNLQMRVEMNDLFAIRPSLKRKSSDNRS